MTTRRPSRLRRVVTTPDEILVAGEEQKRLDIGPRKRGVDDVEREVQIGAGDDLFPAVLIGGALGRIVLRFEAGDIEPVAALLGMLVEIGVGACDRHQSVTERLVAPDDRIGFAPEGIDRRVANILEIDERRDFSRLHARDRLFRHLTDWVDHHRGPLETTNGYAVWLSCSIRDCEENRPQ